MKNKSATGKSVAVTRGVCRRAVARVITGAALLGIVASASADQLLVTGANWSGDSVYDLVINPSSMTPIKPVIANAVTLINKDGTAHGAFDALVWAPNSVCKTLDLIAADATKGQIVRYQGASTLPSCYAATNGGPTVNPTAQIIFKWSKLGSGPARPNGVSADANGNVFVVSSSGPPDPKPSVWVLPFNSKANLYCSAAAGTYCAPVLIDNKFSNTLTLALAETLVANAPAVTSTGTVLWNAGDLLVLVGDSFDARLIVYSSAKTNNIIATHGTALTGPTSTAIPWAKFLGQLAAPFGMDLWPASSGTGASANAGVLFTTIDGRILRFDTVQNKFVSDFADRLGLGLQKLKVGSYANAPYAFVAQLLANGTGQILAFAAPPASGTNKPLALVANKSVMNPVGLAVSSSGVQSVQTVNTGSPCVSPNPACMFTPLGPELVTTIQGGKGDHLSGTVQEQTCSVQVDPRVTIGEEGWSCNPPPGSAQGSGPPALPIGAGTAYCPSFPSAVIPGSVCGHSGPTGSGFAVIEATATGIDPNDNNSFVTTVGNIDSVMPGPLNLECLPFTGGPIPLMAWGTRSDLTTVEGTIPEDSMFGPALGGQAGFLAELTSACDTSTSSSRGISIFAIGLGLSYTDQSDIYAFQNEKFEALQQTVSNANITTTVQTNLAGDISTAENYVTTAQGGGDFTSNINCALNEIATADGVVRNTPGAFGSNLGNAGGNPNPAGDIDGRLANWYLTLNTELAGNSPNAKWPPDSVPMCAPVSTQPQITSYTTNPSGGNQNVDWTSINTNTCTLTTLYAFNSSSDNGYNFMSTIVPTGAPGSDFGGDNIGYIIPNSDDSEVSTPPYTTPGWGSDTYTLTCYGAAGTTSATKSLLNTTGFTQETETPLAISSFTTDGEGDLAWATTNFTAPSDSGPGTVCTITDAFGGTPYNQSPQGNLPANQSLVQSEESPTYIYPYYIDGPAFCPAASGLDAPAQNTDTLTLTCSDQFNGTAMSTLMITNPGCFSN